MQLLQAINKDIFLSFYSNILIHKMTNRFGPFRMKYTSPFKKIIDNWLIDECFAL